ncbi:MAG: ribose-phosphate diphosphokinase, partial [Fusobacteriaceae bacterium]
CKIAIIDKRRPKPNMSEVMNLIGDVEGKTAIFIDDMIDTAGTITGGADAIIAAGAKEAYACCSHGIFSGPAIERIKKSSLKEVVITDSIKQTKNKELDKIVVLTSAGIFAEAMLRIVNNEAVSDLFEKKPV